jgi:uncharacterized membrane protein YfcA
MRSPHSRALTLFSALETLDATLDKRRPNRRDADGGTSINLRSTAAAAVAAALGAFAGGMAASKIPADRFIWTGFALVPLLVLLEVFLNRFAVLFDGNSNAARFTLAGAIVAGFYVTWFAVRSS